MKRIKLHLFLGVISTLILALSCEKPQEPKKPNILLICVDDLRPELKSFGAEHIISPNIDKLAEKGVAFQSHYVNSPSCGPSRYTLLTGKYGSSGNQALFLRSQKIEKGEKVNPSMPEWFRTHGYTTVSVGKVSHHPGGRGGADWNDSTIIEMPNAWDKHLIPVSEWKHPRGVMHGLAHGEIRVKAEDMDLFQAAEGDDNIYPDGRITQEALKQLNILVSDNDKPFFLAVGLIKPHLPFGAPKQYLDKYKNVAFPKVTNTQKPSGRTTWHGSGEFMKYNRWGKNPNEDVEFAEEVRRHYAACVSYADAQVGKLIEELRRSGEDKNTIIVLWGDHGWHLGEHAIWGKHSLFEESLHSPLIIFDPRKTEEGFKTNALVETLDIFPTLCELTDIDKPIFVEGVSLKQILEKKDALGHSVVGYNHRASTLRTKTHRLVLHKDGFVELYDHTTPEKETNNIASERPKLVGKLKQKLKAKLE